MNPNQSAPYRLTYPSRRSLPRRLHRVGHLEHPAPQHLTGSPVHIRRCNASDCAEIHAIITDTTEPFRVESRTPAGWTQDNLRTALSSGMTVWAYERYGVMQGIVCIEEHSPASIIAHIAVRAFRRGYGIGGRLLRHAERHASTPLLVRLDAGAIWTIRFFEKYGYRPVLENGSSHMLDRHRKIAAEDRDLHITLARRNCCRHTPSKNLRALTESGQQRDEREQG
ncbi:MAG: GNAT family N-acetyltransferase [Nitrospiraceae bacterium]|nr:GNAT family N-acetyltransferase [Nitrospiraceae bacterium]